MVTMGGDEVREHIEAQAAEVQAVGEEKRAGNVADNGKLVKVQHGGEGGGGNDADKRAGDLRAPFLRPDEHDGDDQRADEDGLEVRVEAEAGVRGELFEVGAALRDGAEEVIDLPERDDDGDAGGEAHDDGHRNEADEAAELQKSRGEQQYAGGKAGEEDALQPVLRDDADEHGAHRAGGTGDLIGRTAENGNDDAREDGGDESRGGGRAGADAERQRERQRHGADGQARHDVLEELVGVIAGKFGAKIAEKGRKHTHSPRAIPQHGAGAVCTKRRGSHCAVLP